MAALVEAVEGSVPVSVKMRSGFDDTALFEDNLLAAQRGGAAFLTLHPRTKRQAYADGADWSLVARARRLLSVPVVGGGLVVLLLGGGWGLRFALSLLTGRGKGRGRERLGVLCNCQMSWSLCTFGSMWPGPAYARLWFWPFVGVGDFYQGPLRNRIRAPW